MEYDSFFVYYYKIKQWKITQTLPILMDSINAAINELIIASTEMSTLFKLILELNTHYDQYYDQFKSKIIMRQLKTDGQTQW